MKANELSCKDLMVGDWVRIKITQHNTIVTNIDANSVYTEAAFPIRYDEIEPIPLTTEFLEKNGFVVESRRCHGNLLQYCVLVDGLWIVISGENYFEGKLEYAHQLQHALKLCGIKKEIVL